MLSWVVDRCLQARFAKQVVVLTSEERFDDLLHHIAGREH